VATSDASQMQKPENAIKAEPMQAAAVEILSHHIVVW
jgi:hypothetical protein